VLYHLLLYHSYSVYDAERQIFTGYPITLSTLSLCKTDQCRETELLAEQYIRTANVVALHSEMPQYMRTANVVALHSEMSQSMRTANVVALHSECHSI